MSALPPPPPSSPPPSDRPSGTTPEPAAAAPKTPAPPAAAEPPALMPYDDLFGAESAEPEAPPSLTFNIAAAPPPPAPPRNPGAPRPPAEPGVPGMIVGEDRPAFMPPAADELPEPLPVPKPKPPVAAAPAVVPPAQPQAPQPPARPAPRSISQLMEEAGKPAQVIPPPVSAPALPPLPAPPPPSFRDIAPAPVRTPPPGAASFRASRTMPLGPPEVRGMRPAPRSVEEQFAAAFSSDEDDTLVPDQGSAGGSNDEADTVIGTTAPIQRSYGARPSLRLLGGLALLLLVLWLARLGAAPLFDVDEGAFSEATRELVVGHDWGSTTLNGVDRFDKPILVYWLQAISLKTFGVNEFAVRLPSALCAFLWCLALGQFAWRRFGPQAAIAAAGILATSLGPMLIGRAATADSLLNLLLTLSTLDLWRHLENGRDAPRRRAFAFIGLGLLAKGPVALLIPGAAAGLWLAFGRDRSRLLRLVSDAKAWALMVAIAAPWYLYAVWRHGMAFIDGFLLHHNVERFTGSMEGHAGSLFYYLELLPVEMLPWTPLLVPVLWRLRERWREPVGRFMLLWLGFVLAFFSLSGTKLPHYVLYGFTPLMLLAAQELVTAKRGVRVALCVAMLAVVAIGAASPWIAHTAAQRTHDGLYQTLLGTAPAAPWTWVAGPVALLVFALVIWVPNVRTYLSESDGAVAAGLATAGFLVLAVLPWWGQAAQEPIRILARTVPIAQLNLLDRQPVEQWQLHQPSIAFYLGQEVRRVDGAAPAGKNWALTRMDRFDALPQDLRSKYEVVREMRGYALVRPASAASEPLSSIGAAQTAADAASQAAAAQELARAAALAASQAEEAASAAAAAAAAKLTPASAPAPVPAPAPAPAAKR